MNSTKLRLMCSNGGHIVPRPHDKSLCYVGGETRMIVVDRTTTLLDLTHRLSKTLLRSSSTTPAKGCSFILKYQLPSEDLDSLISVTTDEDLENMIEEYERLGSNSRLRLFIFPTNPESASSFLESSIKSEDWFVNVLNGGTNSGFSDTTSVNCLLGLDEDISFSPPDVNQKGINVIGNNSGQDVNSLPDSPMLESSSSFGSASSTPSLAILPPVNSATAIQEQSDPFSLQMTHLKQQEQSMGLDLASVDSVLSDLTNTNDRAADPNHTPDQTARIQIQQEIQNSACLLSMPTTQIDLTRNQLHHQQPQFIPPLQYIHHHHPSGAVPVASYYHHQPHQPRMDHPNLMYYMPTTQLPQAYNFPLQQPQPGHVDAPLNQNDLPAGVYRTTNSGAQQPFIFPSSHHNQHQYVGYSGIHQPSQLVYYATPTMQPRSAAQYNKVTSISPVEGSFQEQVRTAQP